MADASTALLGAKLLNNIHTSFIDKLMASLHLVQGYASTLLYSLIIIELVVFGLIWAMKGDNAFGLLIIKILKIGIFISFIDPGKIWELGFKSGTSMMKLSVEYGTLNIGMSLLYLILGFGTLLLFAAIGAQIILVVALFYITALLVLLLAPFGILKPVEGFFFRSVQALIQAGVRVFAVLIIGLIAFAIWKTLKVDTVSASTDLEKPLALFFTTFVFMIIFYKLPPILAQAVGKIGGNLFEGMGESGGSSVSVSPQAPAAMAPAVAQVSAAANITGGGGGMVMGGGSVTAAAANINMSGGGGGGGSGGGAPAATNVSISGGGLAGGGLAGGGKSKGMNKASNINQSISNKTLSKLKKST